MYKKNDNVAFVPKWTFGTCSLKMLTNPPDDAVLWPVPFRIYFDPSMLIIAYRYPQRLS